MSNRRSGVCYYYRPTNSFTQALRFWCVKFLCFYWLVTKAFPWALLFKPPYFRPTISTKSRLGISVVLYGVHRRAMRLIDLELCNVTLYLIWINQCQ